MKVLLVNTLYPPRSVGGAERSVEELAESLCRDGAEVRVLTLNTSDDVQSDVEVRAGVHVYRYQFPRAWPFGAEWSKLSDLAKIAWHFGEDHSNHAYRWLSANVRDFRPDVVHTNNLAGFGTAPWRAAGDVPIVHTLRDYYLLCTRTTMYRRDRRCESICSDCKFLTSKRRRVARTGPSVFVGVSRAIITAHLERDAILPRQRIEVLRNAPKASKGSLPSSDSSCCNREPDPHGNERSSGVSGSDVTVLGFIGRLEPAKGLAVVVSALQGLIGADFRFVIAGGGRSEHISWIIEVCQTDSRFEYLGVVDPPEFYRRVDVVVVPTQWDEPFGRVAPEAAMAGKSVLASAVGGIPETLPGYTRVSYIRNFTSSESWAQAIAELIDSGVTRHRKQDRWSPNDTPQSVARAYAALYGDVIGASRTPRC